LTLYERLTAAREELIRAGIQPAEAALDVDVYARTILKWDRARLLLHHREPLPDRLEPQFSEWVARRARFEPTAYIVGVREFWGLDFAVTPAVLIPRPETELVVDEATALIRRGFVGPSPRVADIGTGSGCIAVAVAHENRSSTVLATDVSRQALTVARQNAGRHRVADRVRFVCTTYLDGVDVTFDIVAANPPYVRDVDRGGLSADVLQEPHVALFGGDTGLRHIDAVLGTAAKALRPGGWLIMEFGFGQEDDVRALAEQHAALLVHHTRADLQGLARTVIMQRR
jgi:release factor glutamine methyltransferase